MAFPGDSKCNHDNDIEGTKLHAPHCMVLALQAEESKCAKAWSKVTMTISAAHIKESANTLRR